ncbi:U8 snoRNA-decapping enzyme [Hydra vulgaris]|uniref:U8 snoRNA-decapping enzyme n=1 Tax=Hydra vulgaris TaxID=6087 RepID=A0ABM4D290_HYDVU
MGAVMSLSTVTKHTYKLITRAESATLSSSWRHCVHAMIHAPLPEVKLFGWIPVRNAVLMEMRFDGRIGFPGGYVDDSDSSFEDALLREFNEELGELPKMFRFLPDDYLFCHMFNEKKLCLHFYCKQVTFQEFLEIEKRSMEQEYGGYEVLGTLRVPLYIMYDRRGGLPAFLRNNFIGNSKEQLLEAIRLKELVPLNFLNECVNLSNEIDKLSSESRGI